jgi:hypothetical protein
VTSRFASEHLSQLRRTCLAAALVTVAWSHPGGAAPERPRVHPLSEDVEGEINFLSRFGFDAERAALRQSGQTRLRALQRMFTLCERAPKQTARLLDEWLTEQPKLTELEAWLVMKPLARLAKEPSMRRHLGRALAGEHGDGASGTYTSAISKTAALALAKSNHPEAIALLGDWLRRPTNRAEWVKEALLTHRPHPVSPLFEGGGPATRLLVETLGELGDPAAIPFLRRVVKRATADVQAAAAVALAELGVRETLDLAALWAAQSAAAPELLSASARIYFHFDHPAARPTFERLLLRTPHLALELADEYPHAAMLAPLTQHLDQLPQPEDKRRAVRALGQLGAPAVAPLLHWLEANAEASWEVAATIGEIPVLSDIDEVWSSLKNPDLRGPLLTALVASHIHSTTSSPPSMLMSELRRSSEDDPSMVRDLARSGRAVLDERYARELLRRDSLDALVPASHAGAAHGKDYRRDVLRRLHHLAGLPDAQALRLTPETLALAAGLSFVAPTDSISPRLIRALVGLHFPPSESALWQGWSRGGATLGIAPPHPDSTLERRMSYASSRRLRDAGELADVLQQLQSEPSSEVRAALLVNLHTLQDSPTVVRIRRWHQHYDPDSRIRALAAIDEAPRFELRAVWVTPPSTPKPRAQGYWALITQAASPPISFYFNHRHPAVVFVPSFVPQQLPSQDSPRGATLHNWAPNAPDRDASSLRVETVDIDFPPTFE